jgi:DNA-directed RNA polymerase specialized sigma24 family protein
VEFEQLVNRHNKEAVYRQIVRVCGNHADAEDVLRASVNRFFMVRPFRWAGL